MSKPLSSGLQNRMRDAFFSDGRRLAIDGNGKIGSYDAGDHLISGASQSEGVSPSASPSQKHDRHAVDRHRDAIWGGRALELPKPSTCRITQVSIRSPRHRYNKPWQHPRVDR